MLEQESSSANSEPRVIVALDNLTPPDAEALVAQLDPQQCAVKVGKELFVRGGPNTVRAFMTRGFKVFLDLKFFDIPNTIAKACVAAAELGVWMIDVHALGGRRMMLAAHDALAQHAEGGGHRPLLIGVTILTSMDDDDLGDMGLSGTVTDNVMRLATQVQQVGLNGVVCSAQEAAALRELLGPDFLLVTPGIRLEKTEESYADQKRVMTPAEAIEAGVNYLVIGRPITQAEDPAAALSNVLGVL